MESTTLGILMKIRNMTHIMHKNTYFAGFIGALLLLLGLGINLNRTDGTVFKEWEAESAQNVELPFMTGSDSTASGNSYLAINKNQIGIDQKAGTATFEFTLENRQLLQIWIRAKSNTPCVNSFYLSVDGKRRMIAGTGKTDGTWIWVRNSDLALEKGRHVLEILAREQSCLLDKLVLTSNLSYSPI
jgi:hypothetical protein